MSDGPHILLIEHDSAADAFLRTELSPPYLTDARFATATTGEAGLAYAREHQPDLILLCASVQGPDGWAVCKQLKQDSATTHIPVLMTSETPHSATDRIHAMECGADDFLCKPFDPGEIAGRVRMLLRVKKNEDHLRRIQSSLQAEIEQHTADLGASETRFRRMFEQSPDPTFVENEEGTVLDANEAGARLHNIPRAELIGMSVFDLVPPAHRGIVRRDMPRWFSGEINNLESYSYTRDGRVIPVFIKASVIEYNEKPAMLVTVRTMDESPSARQEDERQAETIAGLRAIVEIADELISCPDLDSVYRRAVELSRSRLGIERAGILLDEGMHARGTFGTDLRGETSDERTHTIPMDDVWRERFRLRESNEPRWTLAMEMHKDWKDGLMTDGGRGWIAVTPIQTARKAVGVFCNDSALSKAAFDPVKQELIAVYASLLANIIERKSAESEIAFLATALNQSGIGVVITDVQGIIKHTNPAIEKISGYSSDELRGKHTDFLEGRPGPREQDGAIWETLHAGGQWVGRVINKHKSGREYHAGLVVSAIKSQEGALLGFICAGRDETRDVEMEFALRQAQKMEGIGRLAGGIAHDFNNLLTGILGFAQIIKASLDPADPNQADLDEILNAGDRASRLARQLLALGKKAVVQFQVLDLNAVIAELDPLLRRTLGERIEMITELSPDLPPVETDTGMMEQLLMNLTANARDAMPNGGTLTLRTSRAQISEEDIAGRQHVNPGEYAMLSIRDTGVGMSERVQRHVFEPFFSTKEKGASGGFGLSTVYGIVKHSRGFIELESALGVGTEFRIFLPETQRTPDEIKEGVPITATADAPAAPTKDRRETILLVEDQPAVRRLVARDLAALGYRVLEAAHGGEGIEVFQREPDAVDLVLSDVVMPIMGGVDMVKTLREKRPDIRVIYMSGFTENLRLDEPGAVRPAALILKPFTTQTLDAEIRRQLDAR